MGDWESEFDVDDVGDMMNNFFESLEVRERGWIEDERRAESVARRWELRFLKNIVLKREV